MTQALSTQHSGENQGTASPAEEAARVDLYRFAHRGLRAAMARALLDVGAASTTPEALGFVADTVEELAFLCKKHLEHENVFLHRAMEQRSPGSARNTADDHIGHERAIERLGGSAR